MYFANAMDALFYRYGFPDLGRVLANSILHALGDAHDIELDAPEFVDVSLRVQAKRRLVHLINFPVGKHLNTGWRHAGRTLMPLTNLALSIKLGAGESVREVRIATSEQLIPHVQDGRRVSVTVPALADHEIVVEDVAAGGLQPFEQLDGRLFALDPARLSALGFEHEQQVISVWNARQP